MMYNPQLKKKVWTLFNVGCLTNFTDQLRSFKQLKNDLIKELRLNQFYELLNSTYWIEG